jgi:diphosphomevalonate decarboxylase
MTRSATSSPYYPAWVASHPPDLDIARAAIAARDFTTLAQVSEASCLKMHAAAMSTEPPLIYWNGATVECLRLIRELRADAVPVFFTIDAGPQVKAICLPEAAAGVESALASVPGVRQIIRTRLGPGLETR